jgi:hypothetical protein
VRVSRIVAVLGGVGLLAALTPSLGTSKPARPQRAPADCSRVEYANTLEAVFGRRATSAQANTLRNRVAGRGFVNANIIENCEGFKVVIRGIETFDVGVELQAEARRVGFLITLECVKGKEIGRLEVVFGHGRDSAAAQAIIDRAEAVALRGLRTRPDPCGGFEVYFASFPDRAAAENYLATAKARGFTNALIERN